MGSSLSVEKSIVEVRPGRYLRARSSTIAGIAKIFLRMGSCMHGGFRARVSRGWDAKFGGFAGRLDGPMGLNPTD